MKRGKVMEKTIRKFDDDIQIAYYEFSKDIVCIEVQQHGKSMGEFCSDVSYFQEWDEDDLLQLARTHIMQIKSARRSTEPNRKLIGQYELNYSTHFDEMVCVDVYKNDRQLTAFCCDRNSFEEWIEDEELLNQVIKSQMH